MSEQPTRQVEAVDSEAVPNAAADRPTGASQLSSVGRAASYGLKWSLIGNIITKLGSFIFALVLTRLLSPADFGTYAIALGAMYFLMHVNDVGIIAARGSVAGTFRGHGADCDGPRLRLQRRYLSRMLVPGAGLRRVLGQPECGGHSSAADDRHRNRRCHGGPGGIPAKDLPTYVTKCIERFAEHSEQIRMARRARKLVGQAS